MELLPGTARLHSLMKEVNRAGQPPALCALLDKSWGVFFKIIIVIFNPEFSLCSVCLYSARLYICSSGFKRSCSVAAPREEIPADR